MPYIIPSERPNYDNSVRELAAEIHSKSNGSIGLTRKALGELKFVIQEILLNSFKPYLPNYADYNELIGVLNCAKLEFIMRAGGTVGIVQSHTTSYPDITTSRKTKVNKLVKKIVKSVKQYEKETASPIAGQLNYIITLLLKISKRNLVIGEKGIEILLDTIAVDIYREDIFPYEKKKIKENGDVIV